LVITGMRQADRAALIHNIGADPNVVVP